MLVVPTAREATVQVPGRGSEPEPGAGFAVSPTVPRPAGPGEDNAALARAVRLPCSLTCVVPRPRGDGHHAEFPHLTEVSARFRALTDAPVHQSVPSLEYPPGYAC